MSSLDPSVLFAALPFSLWQWLLVELAIVLAYVVFGIAGFGTALVAGPLLAGVLPLSQIIPLLVLLDFSASFGNWLPARRQIAVTELKRLLPCMLLGCALGAYGLLALRAELLMLALGVFVSLYALYALFLQPRGHDLGVALRCLRRAVRRVVRQRRLPLFAVPERTPGEQGADARHPERADRL